MEKTCKKITSQSLFIGVLAIIGNPALANPEGNSDHFYDTRLIFNLGKAHRYTAQFIEETRTLKILVVDAQVSDFDDVNYYDGHLIHRAILREKGGTVEIDLQLKTGETHWLVTHKSQPWRMVVDLWSKEDPESLERTNWDWNGNYTSVYPQEAKLRKLETLNSMNLERRAGEQSEMLLRLDSRAEKSSRSEMNRVAEPQPFVETPFATAEPGDSGPFRRFIATRKNAETTSQDATAAERAIADFESGRTLDAMNGFRRLAASDPRAFLSLPQTLFYAGESALLSQRIALAEDYFSALIKRHPQSSYAPLAQIRILDIQSVAQDSPQEDIKDGYRRIAKSDTAAWVPKIIAAWKLLTLGAENARQDFLPIFEKCAAESDLIQEIRQDCAYEVFAHKVATDDITSAQASIKTFQSEWPQETRVAQQIRQLEKRIQEYFQSTQRAENYADWIAFERTSDPSWYAFTLETPEALEFRAKSWSNQGNADKTIEFYSRLLEKITEHNERSRILATLANLQVKERRFTEAQDNLSKLKSLPSRTEQGLGKDAIEKIRELALEPYNNMQALSLLLDEIFLGFHAERDIRTLVDLASRIEDSRESDILYEKVLELPARSQTEAELKEDTLFDYAERLRNQGRLIKSADMYLSVANLDNGRNRAEAAYKAGVVYFRAGLLDKATESWNIAANDLENGKYSALAKERLERAN